jgi:hypothetical protein
MLILTSNVIDHVNIHISRSEVKGQVLLCTIASEADCIFLLSLLEGRAEGWREPGGSARLFFTTPMARATTATAKALMNDGPIVSKSQQAVWIARGGGLIRASQ